MVVSLAGADWARRRGVDHQVIVGGNPRSARKIRSDVGGRAPPA